MKKEDFFEVLGELDDDIVKGAKTTMKKNVNWKTWGAIAACLAIVAVLGIGMMQNEVVTPNNEGNVSTDNIPIGNLKPVINFEGVVTAIEGDHVTLKDGTVVIITDETKFMGDPDTGNIVNEDIMVGNFIQGYTEDDTNAEEITASKIWTNEGRTSSGGKRVINFEGRVTKVEENSVTLDTGKTVRITEDTTVTTPDRNSGKINEGDYIQGYAENAESNEIDARYILITAL